MPFLIMMTSVIINDFYRFRAIRAPDEADSPLCIDANAVLALAIALEASTMPDNGLTWVGRMGHFKPKQPLALYP